MTRRYALIALAACITSAALAAQEYFNRDWRGGPLSYDSMLFAQLLGVAAWILLGPTLVVPLARRFPVVESRWNLGVHLVAAPGVALLHVMLVSLAFASYYFGWSPAATFDILRDRMHTVYTWSVVVYVALLGALTLGRRHAPAPSPPRTGEQADPQTPQFVRRIVIKADGRLGVVPVEQVDWLEASDNHVIVHAAGARHMMRTPLGRLAARLDPHTFVRVHRSTIVNIERVREVQPWFQGDLVVILRDDTRLTIGRRYRESFLASLER